MTITIENIPIAIDDALPQQSVDALTQIAQPEYTQHSDMPTTPQLSESTTLKAVEENQEALIELRQFLLRKGCKLQDVDDRIQETLIRALQAPNQYDPEHPHANITGFLVRIGQRALIDAWRKENSSIRSRSQSYEMTPERYTDTAIDNVAASVSEQEVARLLGLLSSNKRAVISLVLKGYSQSEITAQLGLPEGTVKSRRLRAYQALRSCLETESAADKNALTKQQQLQVMIRSRQHFNQNAAETIAASRKRAARNLVSLVITS